MNRDEMFKLVSGLLHNTPEREAVEVTWQTDPFVQLGMDSLDGIVFATVFSERLGIEISPDDNPLVDDKKERPRLVSEIVDWGLAVLENYEQSRKKEADRAAK
jgi:acyl carrier protein